jgi:hypothetical protein
MALIALAVVPPRLPRNFALTILTDQQTPATPPPLPPSAPMLPATWVP